VAVPYVTDNGTWCDITCKELNDEWREYMDAQSDMRNADLILAQLNPVMD
jgi:hypothetical protein